MHSLVEAGINPIIALIPPFSCKNMGQGTSVQRPCSLESNIIPVPDLTTFSNAV